MNIFYLDEKTENCAKFLHNVHLNKMITETAQMLCTCIREVDSKFTGKHEEVLYKTFCKNHPCNIWLRDGFNNFLWLADLFWEMKNEYAYRNNGATHGSYIKLSEVIWEFITTSRNEFKTTVSEMKPVQVMPDYYQIEDDPIQAYRDYYKGSKMTDKNGKMIAYWGDKREMPDWL